MNNDRFRFRAWNKNTGKMIDLNLITPLALSESRDGVFVPFSKESIVMQCTGLKDRNRQLVFEADILKHTAPEDKERFIISKVIWDKEAVWLIEFQDKSKLGLIPDLWEIIGNLYETPELLDDNNE